MSYNRWRIFERDGYHCVYCGAHASETKLHVDHRHPRSKGGTDHHLNLVTACAACNQSKSNRVPQWEPCTPIPGPFQAERLGALSNPGVSCFIALIAPSREAWRKANPGRTFDDWANEHSDLIGEIHLKADAAWGQDGLGTAGCEGSA